MQESTTNLSIARDSSLIYSKPIPLTEVTSFNTYCQNIAVISSLFGEVEKFLTHQRIQVRKLRDISPIHESVMEISRLVGASNDDNLKTTWKAILHELNKKSFQCIGKGNYYFNCNPALHLMERTSSVTKVSVNLQDLNNFKDVYEAISKIDGSKAFQGIDPQNLNKFKENYAVISTTIEVIFQPLIEDVASQHSNMSLKNDETLSTMAEDLVRNLGLQSLNKFKDTYQEITSIVNKPKENDKTLSTIGDNIPEVLVRDFSLQSLNNFKENYPIVSKVLDRSSETLAQTLGWQNLENFKDTYKAINAIVNKPKENDKTLSSIVDNIPEALIRYLGLQSLKEINEIYPTISRVLDKSPETLTKDLGLQTLKKFKDTYQAIDTIVSKMLDTLVTVEELDLNTPQSFDLAVNSIVKLNQEASETLYPPSFVKELLSLHASNGIRCFIAKNAESEAVGCLWGFEAETTQEEKIFHIWDVVTKNNMPGIKIAHKLMRSVEDTFKSMKEDENPPSILSLNVEQTDKKTFRLLKKFEFQVDNSTTKKVDQVFCYKLLSDKDDQTIDSVILIKESKGFIKKFKRKMFFPKFVFYELIHAVNTVWAKMRYR